MRRHLLTPAAALAAALAAATVALAQQPLRPQPHALPSGSASASSSAPLGPVVPPGATPLEAATIFANATDYPRAEQSLLAIHGADQPAALVVLARILLEQGRFGDAERFATQAQATPATKLQALALRGRILAAQGKAKDAIALLDPAKDEPGDGGRRVRLVLGELLIAGGKRADAEPILKKFAEEWNNDTITDKDPVGMSQIGRAMHLLRVPKDANDMFKQSYKLDKKSLDLLLWHAELFLDKYDDGHAEEVVRDLLKLAPKNADALVLMARVKLDSAYDFDEAEKLTKKALEVNPKHVGARAIRAGLALRDLDIQLAEQEIAAGMAVDPNDLELWAMKGATRFLADDRAGYDAAKREALAKNPSFSQFFGIVGEFAEWEHRYDDIIAMMKEAVQVDAEDAKAWAQLGLNQARAGDETSAIASLQTARNKDTFNVRVYNTLEFLYKKWIPRDYVMGGEDAFKIRYPKDEQKILERYVPQFLARAFGSMKGRYDFSPTMPIQVELYSDRQAFSVRTSGLPNIGIQGVCFGKVVASMSPKSEPFNWGNVLWHELGHVFAIQLSKNHVPRWFTEGLSEYETIVRRPEWRRELDPELYEALTKNLLPGAVDMNKAFTHQGEIDVTTAYYAASQMIVYTAERFGFAKITEALTLWGQGVRTADVISRAFGVSPKEYDDGYRAWQHKKLARYDGQFVFKPKPKPLDEAKAAAAATPQRADAHVDYAMALLRARKLDEAQHEIDEALRLDPNDKNAHYLAYKLGKHDVAKKEEHLRAIQHAGGDGYAIQIALADVAEEKKDKDAMRAAFIRANRFDPTQSEPLKGLYDLAKEAKDDAAQLDALRKIAPLEQHDPHVWHLLLEKLTAQKLWVEARSVGESAIFVDVESGSTHTSYGRALAALGHHDKALFELESALYCAPKPQEAATAHALMARSYLALGDKAQAKTHLDEALRIEPGNQEAQGISIP